MVARVDAKSKAFEAGIRPGQLFVEVNGMGAMLGMASAAPVYFDVGYILVYGAGSPCKTLAEFEKRVGSLILFEAKVYDSYPGHLLRRYRRS